MRSERDLCMPLFEWKEEYAVDVEWMDRDHRDILNLALALEAAVDAGAAKAELVRKFDDTLNALRERMAREEDLLQQAGYPALRFHKREHDDLIEILTEFHGRAAEGEATICQSSLEFLGGWLIGHFSSEDRCAGQFLLELAKTS